MTFIKNVFELICFNTKSSIYLASYHQFSVVLLLLCSQNPTNFLVAELMIIVLYISVLKYR